MITLAAQRRCRGRPGSPGCSGGPPTSVKVLPYSWVGDVTCPASRPSDARDEVRQARSPSGRCCAATPAGRRGRGRSAAARPCATPSDEQRERCAPRKTRPLPVRPQVEVAGPGQEPGEEAGGNGAPARGSANAVSSLPAGERAQSGAWYTARFAARQAGTLTPTRPALKMERLDVSRVTRRYSRRCAWPSPSRWSPPGAAPGPRPTILPLDQVRPGMTGVGRTVFEGTRIEEFSVTILGVLENVGPKQSLILARLEGGPLAETGVIAGMSGSPVFIDGKLVGAVAYGFPFSKETIAGITPIGEMIEATRTETPRAAVGALPAALRRRRAGPPARPRGASWRRCAARCPGRLRARRRGAASALPSGSLAGASLHAAVAAPRLLGLRPRDLRVGARRLRRPRASRRSSAPARAGAAGAAAARPAAGRRRSASRSSRATSTSR